MAHSPEELDRNVRRVWERYHQPAIAEEYLPGDEITVGVVGNGSPSVVGMMRISPVVHSGEFLYSLEEKRNYLQRIRYDGPESIPAPLRNQIGQYAVMAFHAMELRDMARVDFRLDGDGIPKIIDINPLPGLSPAYSDLPILHRLSGGEYECLIRSILRSSFSRNSLLFPSIPEGGR